ncbi:MAG: Gfo/Idh/MocA family oxidoreductase [Clostridia bacterium]|nr:Gfo/Idh/MocA family oxidoreductase [Clostridia bacterium]
MKQVRFAVVGGGMGKSHIKGISEIPEATLTAFCDIDEKIAKTVAEANGLDKYYTDYYEMLRDGGFDCIVLCTPDQIHREQCVAALEMGYHVLCEKPLALNMDDCRAIDEAAKASKGKFMVGQICRKTPGFIKAKELIDAGKIGDIFFIESEYAHDYAHIVSPWRWDTKNLRPAITGGGCHAVDLIRWLAGDPIEVMAYSNHKVLLDKPVDDCTVAILKFNDNVIGKVFCSIGCKRNYTMRTLIYGTKGTIICDNRSASIQLFEMGNLDENGHEKYEPVQYPVDINHHNATGEIKDMCDIILGDLPVTITAAEGSNTVAVCEAILKSCAEGTPVSPEYIV